MKVRFIWLLLFLTCSLRADVPTLGGATQEIAGVTYRVFVALPKTVQLHWTDPRDGQNFGYFADVKKYLSSQNRTVTFLTNAGIYGKDDKPAGLHVEAGNILHALNTKHGKGNFHIQPNGVFFIKHNEQAGIMTTQSYQKHHPKSKHIRLATQSGPMILIDGKINRQFLKNGESTHYRSGVCVIDGNVTFFKNTSEAVNFYDFAQAAKSLGCRDALYLDGKISKFYQPHKDVLWHLSHFVGILSVTEEGK